MTTTHLQQQHIETFAYQTIKEGKNMCGDSYYFTATDDFFLCVLADGLGSGEGAFESSSAVVEVVKANLERDVDTLMTECNNVLTRKRGAAVAILKVYFNEHRFDYSCVGNIRFYLYTPGEKIKYPLPVTGFLSGKKQRLHTQQFSYEPRSKFILHSDGFILKNLHSFMRSPQSVPAIATDLKHKRELTNDDSTFIVGSLT